MQLSSINVGKVQLDCITLLFTSMEAFNGDHIVFQENKLVKQTLKIIPSVRYKCVIKNK